MFWYDFIIDSTLLSFVSFSFITVSLLFLTKILLDYSEI